MHKANYCHPKMFVLYLFVSKEKRLFYLPQFSYFYVSDSHSNDVAQRKKLIKMLCLFSALFHVPCILISVYIGPKNKYYIHIHYIKYAFQMNYVGCKLRHLLFTIFFFVCSSVYTKKHNVTNAQPFSM